MDIVIVGPGALGCLLGAMLHRGASPADDSITILDYNKNRAEILNEQGLRYENKGDLTRFRLAVVSSPAAIARADVLLICVKSYDIDPTLSFCRPLIGNDTLLIFMQNGIAHLRHRHLAAGASAFATTTEGSTNLGPGHIRHAGAGRTFLGFLDPPPEKQRLLLPQIVDRLRRGGLSVAESEEILDRIWAKLFINVGINALTVLHDCPNGELLAKPEACRQMKQAVAEAETVARMEKIVIRAPLGNTLEVCRATAQNISSMLQDVRRKRRTEIDAINGAIVEMANRYGTASPMNSFLVRRVKEIEAGY